MRSTCALLLLLAAPPFARTQDVALPLSAPVKELVQTQGPAVLQIQAPAQPLSLADIVLVTVRIALAEGEKIEPPRQLDADAPWTVVERSQPLAGRAHDNTPTWQQTYRLAPLTPGKLTLQVPSFRLVRAEGSERIDWQPVSFDVAAPQLEADPSLARWTPHFELPPEDVPRGRSTVWLWLLVLATLGAWLALGRSRRPCKVRRRSADVWARARLQRLQSHLHSPRFADLLTLILRRYLQRTALPFARRRNTTELLEAVQACAGLEARQKACLTKILRQCDQAKYAAVRLDPEEARQLLADGMAFVAAQRRG